MASQYNVLDAYPKIGPAEKAGIIKAFEKERSESEGFEEFFAKNYLSQNPIYPSNGKLGVSLSPKTEPSAKTEPSPSAKTELLPVSFGAFRRDPSQIELERDESRTIWEILSDKRNFRYTGKFVSDVNMNKNEQVKELLSRKSDGDPMLIDGVMFSSPFEMTVFVPSNDAYKLGEEANVLYHIVWGKYSHLGPREGDNLLHQTTPTLLTTMYQKRVMVSKAKGIQVGGADLNYGTQASANIIYSDIRANNGIIHIIDNVLSPEESAPIPASKKSNDEFALPEFFISSDANGVDSKRKKRVIKSRYKEIKAKEPETIHAKAVDKISFNEPVSFVDRISFSESPSPDSFIDQISFDEATPADSFTDRTLLTESKSPDSFTKQPESNPQTSLTKKEKLKTVATLKVGLDVLGKYFNLPDDSKSLFKDKNERGVMLTEANNIISSLKVDNSNKSGKVKISLNSDSYLGNEYSYFSPQKVKKMKTKDLMRFVALTSALDNVSAPPKIEAFFGSSIGSKLANNLNSWIEDIMKDVEGIESDVDLYRLTVTEKSGRVAKKIYQKGGVLMVREVAWVITHISYVLLQILRFTYPHGKFRSAMETTLDQLYKNFGYLGISNQLPTNAQNFFSSFRNAEDKIAVNMVDLTKKVRKEELPNLQNNMILNEAEETKIRLFSLLKVGEKTAPNLHYQNDPNFVKLNLVALALATLLSDLYHDNKLDDKAREAQGHKNSITRNNIWSQTLEPFFTQVNLLYPNQE